MTAADRLWIKAMNAGARLGCHQRADRSFFLFGRQFPVCARCTGVMIGQLAVFLFGSRLADRLTPPKCLCFMLIMLADHTAQTLGRGSTNTRRLVTGFLAGLAAGRAYHAILSLLIGKSERTVVS